MGITIEQLIDIVQAELTISGLFPKVLPDAEIKRIIKERVMEWFYKNYQFSVIKTYYFLRKDYMCSDEWTQYRYLTMPEEIEGLTRIVILDNPSLFRIGIQAPNLSINFGVTNQPYLTSFVTNVGELGTYRQILSAFSDEINKLAKNYVKFTFNHVSKRLHLLDAVAWDMVLEVYARIPQEMLFDNYLFKDFCIGMAKMRLGEALGRFTFNLPGNFQYNAGDMISQGQALVDETKELIKGETQVAWFKMAR